MREMFGVPIPENPADLRRLDPVAFARSVKRLPVFARGMVLRELRRWTKDLELWRQAQDDGAEEQRLRLESMLVKEMEKWLGFSIPPDEHGDAVAKLSRCQRALAEEGIV